MTEKIDARGLSCPQPIFLTQEAIWKLKSGTIEVLVDDPTALQNILRTAEKVGWSVDVVEISEDDCLLTLTKQLTIPKK